VTLLTPHNYHLMLLYHTSLTSFLSIFLIALSVEQFSL
jgi:hypothetical protein